MPRYIARKLLLVLPLLWGVVTLIFILIELSPGDVVSKFITPETTPEVAEMITAKYGLDKPAFFRYLLLLKNLAMLDFGVSMVQERPVFAIIMETLPNTLILSLCTMAVLFPIGIALGTFQAVRRGRVSDTAASVTSLFFYSMPSFWLALMLQLAFAVWLKLLPLSGMYDAVQFDYMTPGEQLRDRALHLVLPALAMGVAHAAGVARYMRSSVLEVLNQDYIRTARAKGLKERQVILRHALRNAMLPIITLVGLSLPALFGGSVLVEYIFAWPGMGRLIIAAINSQDTPVIMGCFFMFTVIVVVGNLLADLAYAVVDPRIKYD
jgi:peptide/nickel transport system permease protein